MLEALKTDVVSKQFVDPSADKSTTQIVSCKSNVELFDKFGTAGRIGIVLLSVTTVTGSFVRGYLSRLFTRDLYGASEFSGAIL